MVFPEESAAIGYCEGWDVSEGGWLFFAADGCPMEPIFSEPASKSGWDFPWPLFTAPNRSI
jgi:hypothetical protein